MIPAAALYRLIRRADQVRQPLPLALVDIAIRIDHVGPWRDFHAHSMDAVREYLAARFVPRPLRAAGAEAVGRGASSLYGYRAGGAVAAAVVSHHLDAVRGSHVQTALEERVAAHRLIVPTIERHVVAQPRDRVPNDIDPSGAGAGAQILRRLNRRRIHSDRHRIELSAVGSEQLHGAGADIATVDLHPPRVLRRISVGLAA